MNKTDKYAKILWDYHHLGMKPEKSDILMCFTSLDLSVPEYLAELFKQGFSSQVLISGGNAHNQWIPDEDNVQKTDWGTDSEAEKYFEVAVENGVPEDKIILETESTNSGENVEFTYKILKEKSLLPRKVLLVHKPTMERRAYSGFMNFWPDPVELIVVSAPYTYEEYVGKIVERDTIINIMIGDLQRMKIYPKMGFQIPQEIPDNVQIAYEKLVKLGYDKHLIKE